jgi:hypothetical protein
MNTNKNFDVGTGCLIVFSLPFAAAGVGALGMILWSLATWVSVQSWREVPAQIERVNLDHNRSDDGTTYRVEARYSYEWQRGRYEGDRVSLYSASDNVGSFQQRVAAELSEHRDKGIPFRCYVNPDNPEQAVLYRNLRVEILGLMLLVCLLFGGVGFGLLAGTLYGWRTIRQREDLRYQHPDEPWRWRKEWETGAIFADTKAKMVSVFVLAAFWNLISSPMLFVMPGELRGGNYAALIGLLFPLVGAVLIVLVVYLALQWRRYGAAVFEMGGVPGVVGGLLHGQIRIPTVVLPEEEALVILDCVNRLTTGSGDSRHTSETILWHRETTISCSQLVRDGRATVIPVRFVVPVDKPPTDDSDSNNTTLWWLRANIATSGVDFSANFEVPVFRTAQSAAAGSGAVLGDSPVVIAFDAEGNPIPDNDTPDHAETGKALRRAGVLTKPCMGGGVALVFPMLRLPVPAFVMLFCTVFVAGSLALILHERVPLVFPVVLGLFFLITLYVTLDLFVGTRRIEITRRGILVRGGLFGLGPVRQISFDEFGGMDTKSTMVIGGQSYYAVDIKRRGGGTLRIANRLRQEETFAVVQAVETAIGDYR